MKGSIRKRTLLRAEASCAALVGCADRLTPDALQALMRHESYHTTHKYINLARQMHAAVASLHVPEVLKAGIAI